MGCGQSSQPEHPVQNAVAANRPRTRDDVVLKETQQKWLDWLKSLRVGSKVDALDTGNEWFTAEIKEKKGAMQVLVHFDGWEDKWDEWLDLLSGRISPLKSKAAGGREAGGVAGKAVNPINDPFPDIIAPPAVTLRQISIYWLLNLKVGDKVDVRDTEGWWYTAVIIQTEKELKIHVHWDGWDDKFDEWIILRSGRIAPLNKVAIGGAHSGGREHTRIPISFSSGYLTDTEVDIEWLQSLQVGDKVDACDEEGNWFTSVVKIKEEARAQVEFDGWGDFFDEWINLTSGKIAPFMRVAIGGCNESGGIKHDPFVIKNK